MVCKVEGCVMKHFAFGLCRKHHARFKRHGTTESKYDKAGYAKLGGVKDPRPWARGSLAVNLINDIKNKALKRGKSWGLTHEQAFELITEDCLYCGFLPVWPDSRNGIDRVDNSRGYEYDNCAPCCFTCNSSKGTRNLKEHVEWVVRSYRHLLTSGMLRDLDIEQTPPREA